jgi:hypothetical protein
VFDIHTSSEAAAPAAGDPANTALVSVAILFSRLPYPD